MHSIHLLAVLLLLTLLPVSVLTYGSTVESIIDSILRDAPHYLTANSVNTHVQTVDSIVRSCPLYFDQILMHGETTYTFSICINATGLTIIPPTSLLDTIKIGGIKLDLSMQVKNGVRPEVKVELSAPVFDDVYVQKWFIFVPAGYLKSTIISEAKKLIERELQSFVASLR